MFFSNKELGIQELGIHFHIRNIVAIALLVLELKIGEGNDITWGMILMSWGDEEFE